MHNDRLEVDELILELADYKNDYADMAAEKLLRKCSTNWEAYQYLRNRVNDAWLPDSARQQVRRIIKQIQVRLYQQREFSSADEPLCCAATAGKTLHEIVHKEACRSKSRVI
jgi:hypothetical protein